jgi:hypothetical protein
MSFTITVPADVPFERQSSSPFVPLVARKNNMALTTLKSEGLPSEEPGAMSFTINVLIDVPSERQSSTPFVPSVAEKKSTPLRTVRYSG